MTSKFEELMTAYDEQCGVTINGKRTEACHCIEFAEDGFPSHHTLGSKALEHGFVISAVDPTNALSDDGDIPVFFKLFSVEKETRTVEVEKEATVVRSGGDEHVIIDQ